MPLTRQNHAMVMALLALAAPAAASVMISGVPSASLPGGNPVVLQYHSVTALLGTKDVSYASRTVFYNPTKQDVVVEIKVPFKAIQTLDHRRMLEAPVGGTLDGVTVSFRRNPKDLSASSVKGHGKDRYDYSAAMHAQVTFKALSSHVLTLSYALPTGLAGEDEALRTVGYGTQGFSTWAGKCEQLAFTLDFARETYRSNPADPDERYQGYSVFAMHSTEPGRDWEVGEKRAFFERYKPTAALGTLFFTFYPNGYRGG